MQLIEPFSCPSLDVAFPALLGSEERQSDQIINSDHIFFVLVGKLGPRDIFRTTLLL